MGQHYTLALGADMGAATADLIQQAHANALTDVTILTPTARAAEMITQGFLAQQQTSFLPRILPLDPNAAGITLQDKKAVINPLQRQLFLYQQILARAKAEAHPLTPEQALKAATSLEHLLDKFMFHHITAAHIQAELNAQNLPEHLTQNLLFVDILLTTYPAYLAAQNLQDPISYQHAQFTTWAEKLTAANTPVYTVGFQDTSPTAAPFLAQIAQSTHGHIIAPTLHSPDTPLEDLTPLNPDYTLRHLMQSMAISPPDLHPLGTVKKAPAYTLLTAKHPEEEVQLAALLLKEAHHNGTRAMLVTPTPHFGAAVNAHLSTWGLTADDSAGIPLSQTPAGSFFLLIAELAHSVNLQALVALTQHALFQSSPQHTAAFNSLVLRGLPPNNPSLKGYAQKLLSAQYSHPKPTPASLQNAQQVLDALHHALTPLIDAPKNTELNSYITALITTYTALTNAPLLSDIEDIIPSILTEVDLLNLSAPQAIYATLKHILDHTTYRSSAATNLLIRGPVQARYEHGVERLILANLTTEDWPKQPSPDGWLNANLIAALGLPTPEIALGLGSAHFLALTQMGQEVMLLRATTNAGLPVPASSCLTQFITKLNPPEIEAMTKRGDVYNSYLNTLFGTTDNLVHYSPNNTLTDPVHKNEEWSASFIEGLMACPYKTRLERFYKLAPPNPYNQEEDARDKGTLFHTCLQAFFTQAQHAPPNLPTPFGALITPDNLTAAHTHFMAIADVYLRFIHAAIAPVWRARLNVQAQLFLQKMIDIQTQNRTPKLFEERGKLNFAGIVLTAQADRIDVQTGQTFGTIIDYKTGAPPNWSAVKSGLKPQLLVESILANNGAFGSDVTATQALEYWHLGTGKTDFNVTELPLKEEDVTAAEEGLENLITHHVTSHHFTAVPGGAGRLADGICTYCDFSSICRFKNQNSA